MSFDVTGWSAGAMLEAFCDLPRKKLIPREGLFTTLDLELITLSMITLPRSSTPIEQYLANRKQRTCLKIRIL